MPAASRSRTHNARVIPCPVAGCKRLFSDRSGISRHVKASHRRLKRTAPEHPSLRTSTDRNEAQGPSRSSSPLADSSPRPISLTSDSLQPDSSSSPRVTESHPFLDGMHTYHLSHSVNSDGCRIGRPCDANGNFVPTGTAPPPRSQRPFGDFSPFDSREQFEMADFLYRRTQMSAGKIDELMELITAILPPESDPPFVDHNDCYAMIDAIDIGGVPWQSFTGAYNGTVPAVDPPPWMSRTYNVWYRCPRQLAHEMIGNPDFAGEMDYAPKRVFGSGEKREYEDFMSGNWAWKQAVSSIACRALCSP